jgi:hypothetical protein
MDNLRSVAGLIQLAVAPIFLLSAVATTLLVFAGRLARIVDRGRFLEERGEGLLPRHQAELRMLERRARIIYWALSLGVTAALFVCLVMTLVFAGEIYGWHVGSALSVLFLAALFSFTAALVCLLREVFLAVANFRLGVQDAAGR